MNSRVRSTVGAGLAALTLVSGSALGGLLFDEDPDWKEVEVTMPPPVDDARLRAFFVSSASPNSFFVDEGSVSVGEDRVVRYTLVVRTPGGAENITYEGLRCATGERRIYASGRRNGEWTPMKKSDWQPISDNNYNRPRAALAYEHFCDGPAAPRDLEHALRLLRNPLHRSSTYGVR
ncbi:CNP1-like family protein [Thauera sp. Sel9]|uniref:CNP1-like family protein n=1 Tax=Thauera sp. Sel9 TaxID=2974299 RepID=UPI0021E10660|nr:CNP1-like family protein [Thauera sp. Sel9]MCV2218567.1 CNP1-like family protein [Thauera sp. Sel9]